MKYPANPKTNLKDEYEALKKQRDEEIEWERRMADKREDGRKEYLNQLKLLERNNATSASAKELESQRGWFSWLGKWRGTRAGGDDDDETSSSAKSS